jgi:hypothetical protein
MRYRRILMYFEETDEFAARAGLSRLAFPSIFAHDWLDAFSGG